VIFVDSVTDNRPLKAIPLSEIDIGRDWGAQYEQDGNFKTDRRPPLLHINTGTAGTRGNSERTGRSRRILR